jgi:copper chaperone CopZ
MTKITLEVDDLFSVLGAHGIERQLQHIAGVGRVSVNPVSGSTTIMFDPEKTSPPAIQEAIRDCGFHCAWRSTAQAYLRKVPDAEFWSEGSDQPAQACTFPNA